MSNILVQFPEIQQAINQAGTSSVTLGPPTFKKSTVEFTELVSDSTGIHLNHWGWGSNDTQKKDFATAFKLSNTDMYRLRQWFGTTQAYATMDKGTEFYYRTDQVITRIGIIGNDLSYYRCYLLSFNLNRYFYFDGYTKNNYQRQVPVLQKNGG